MVPQRLALSVSIAIDETEYTLAVVT